MKSTAAIGIALVVLIHSAAGAVLIQQDLTATLYSTNYDRGLNQQSFAKPWRESGATPGQFQSVVPIGALVVPTPGATLLPGSYVANAAALNLPRAASGERITLVLRSASVGAPTHGQLAAFVFGSVVSPPDRDIGGGLLASPATFWVAEPYSVNGHANAGYYWSPHAQKVFATQPGPIQVTWRKAQPADGTLTANKVTLGGLDYALTNVSYRVSGAAARTPRKLYWTEKSFRATGKPVSVPRARVSAVYFHYNSSFTRTVSEEYVALGSSSPTEGSTSATLKELRTAWYDDDQGLILAYNIEGRVFLELLGDANGDGTRKHLGYEVVDVIRQPSPADRVVALGDKITAYTDGRPDVDLLPDPILVSQSSGFLYRDALGSNGRSDFYAVKETVNVNDSLVHWLEEGEVGLRWPAILARYRQVWPEDVARYSQYVRPPADSKEAAAKTAVPLPGENIPILQYQDSLDQPRGFLTERSQYYTWLDSAHPFHRGLIRLISGERVAFERVLSLSQASILDSQAAAGTPSDSFVQFNPVYSRNREGRFVTAPWTDELSSGIGPGTLWAAHFGSSTATIINDVTVTGYGGPGTTNANFELSGATLVYPSDSNDLTAQREGGSRVVGQAFVHGGAPRLKLKNLEPGRKYVVAFLSVKFDDGERLVAFSSGGDSAIVDQSLYGARKGIRTDYTFTASGREKSISVDPVLITRTFHLYGLSLSRWTGEMAAGTLPLERVPLLPETTVNAEHPIMSHPRYMQQTVKVGERIVPPSGEAGGLAGHIHVPTGNSFHPAAYRDPLDLKVGFEAAKQGAIIPVNAIPGRDLLEVWWFRANRTDAVKNPTNGFKAIYWPSVVARYSLVWPEDAFEIVMAGDDGSGPLESLQAKGAIYTQNETKLPGYNPNEEHALMIGGQAYALRDDLNITNGPTFSSLPYVLVDYTADDGRPAILPFKVLREKPEAGMRFDYVVEAGSRIKAPMPLRIMPAPIELVTTPFGTLAINANLEIPPSTPDLPADWSADFASGRYSRYASFTYRDRKQEFWVMRGVHAGLPKLEAGRYQTPSGSFVTTVTNGGALGASFTNYIHTSRCIDSLVATLDSATPLPSGLRFGKLRDGLAVYGTLSANTGTYTGTYRLIVTDEDESVARVTLILNDKPAQEPALNLNGFLGRPPALALAPAAGKTIPTNAFRMQFYYFTQNGFAWPGNKHPPAVGTIAPYLRPAGSTRVEDGVGSVRDRLALEIVYRPTWPQRAHEIEFGETLTVASGSRPAIRGQTSAHVLYQQAIATNGVSNGEAGAAVLLHDPTVQKTYPLFSDPSEGLAGLPAGVSTQPYQGRIFFPTLPPHLAGRFFLDPAIGEKGSLVFKGEFKDEALGDEYLLLNVLGRTDLATLKKLCPAADGDKSNWDKAVEGLSVDVKTFTESTSVPGQFVVNTGLTSIRRATELVVIADVNSAVDSYALSAAGPGSGFVTVVVGDGGKFTPAGDPVSMYVLRVTGPLHQGKLKILESANPLNEVITFAHTADLGARTAQYEYEWKSAPPVDGSQPLVDATMSRYQALTNGVDIPSYTLGGSGIQALVDNWVVMRYRPKHPNHLLHDQWSEWTKPQLAEGWIKRVLAKINPFNQRMTTLYNNSLNTDVSILTQAGKRYEGDIALNLASLDSYGLIEIYETILKRGRGLSIDAGTNFGPANDIMLLAAGYLNDLYMLVGNEAYADAANPTIGIGTKDRTYGSIATALFAFRGQVASLLEEELALLRGRDDFALPGVDLPPVYNRLVWNYTRGIDAGEVIYALNYNILDQSNDGQADAADAAVLYPQGHGDAYGHYLTALKGYYSLLANANFDWVPRAEAVTILGEDVSVDYLDERKFAAAATAVARTGRQVFDLTWRQYYVPGRDSGWAYLSTNRVSSRVLLNGKTQVNVVRQWGADHWASRTGQGALLHWVVGNAILPEKDPDRSREGIQRVDRTTVPELQELASIFSDLQTGVDNAEGRMSPLGIPEGGLAFDLDPNRIVGTPEGAHFEQIYSRAKGALSNAVAAFDDAKDVTQLMRSEEDSLADLRATLAAQELAYNNTLIGLYGTPYPGDIGPGGRYKQGYEGPDLFHYSYVETPEIHFGSSTGPFLDTEAPVTIRVDMQDYPAGWVFGAHDDPTAFDFLKIGTEGGPDFVDTRSNKGDYIEYTLSPHGYFKKPADWKGTRRSPGELQQAISEVIKGRSGLLQALDDAKGAKEDLDAAIRIFKAGLDTNAKIDAANIGLSTGGLIMDAVERYAEVYHAVSDGVEETTRHTAILLATALPTSTIIGVASGGDLTAQARAAIGAVGELAADVFNAVDLARGAIVATIRTVHDATAAGVELGYIAPLERKQERLEALHELEGTMNDLQGLAYHINRALQNYDDAQRKMTGLVAKGDRLLQERASARQRVAAVIQGFRTRDAAFRIFRNEKLERYKTLFDLAARYALMAANAYDYETGLLGTPKGRAFVNRIVSSRALGVVRDGEPQYAGSNTGDPGLSSALAEMKADWDVLRGRLGINNPDPYSTLASLRVEKERILPGVDGNTNWKDILNGARRANILDDTDVRRNCLQIDGGDGLPVPGIILNFGTTISEGVNLFGRPLASGDHSFSPSSFATKLFGVGIVLEGYRGMGDPAANAGATGGAGPADPSSWFLDPDGLSATPYVYLIPVGVDSMRSPPLGDTSTIRTWMVEDLAIPLPFNLGASDFSTRKVYQSADSLSEPLFATRKHQAFRPLSDAGKLGLVFYGNTMPRAEYVNTRLIGRSVWNSHWKLVIPGRTLLTDPNEGLDRFIRTVRDIKLYLQTYSYSGN